jgi:hypothetical protein
LARQTVRLILSPKNLNQNAGLFHFTGIKLTPIAKPKTISKLLDVLFTANDFFLREWWLDKRQER